MRAEPQPPSRANSSRLSISRALDILIAATALIVLSPLLLLIAFAVWLDSGGPIFFRQLRIGQRGQHFWIYKFRKFHPTIVEMNGPLTLRNDPRLTRVGRLLEATKLNELPQFWNVLKGEMSLVGPRPEMLEYGDCFSPNYLEVLEHRPGIFGPSQAVFRSEGTLYPVNVDRDQFYRQILFPTKARLDLAYFSHRTAWSDLAWIFYGVLAVLGWSHLPDELSKVGGLRLPVKNN